MHGIMFWAVSHAEQRHVMPPTAVLSFVNDEPDGLLLLAGKVCHRIRTWMAGAGVVGDSFVVCERAALAVRAALACAH